MTTSPPGGRAMAPATISHVDATRRRVAVIGAGYVGTVTGVGLAHLGHEVLLVETNPERLSLLREGRIPIHEEGVQAAFDAARDAGRLDVADRLEGSHDAILLCIGTPIDASGRSDLQQVRTAVADVAAQVARGTPLVIRSTLPPGATRLVVDWSGAATSHVVTNPEFLRQGTALQDFLHPARVVVGTFRDADPAIVDMVLGLFDGIPGPRLVVSVAAAELIKNGSNAFLALKLSFANELASLSEEYGADVDEVLRGITLDPRIGSQYMRPALGFGGSCLPKELKVLGAAGTARGLDMHVTTAASDANAASIDRFAGRVAGALGGLAGRRIALLGLAFKAGTDDVRDSPALSVAARLLDGGAEVVAYDPYASENARRAMPRIEIAASAEIALRGADAALIATEWPEFAALPWAELGAAMRRPLVIDGRRLVDGDTLRRAGFTYLAVGTADPGVGGRSGMSIADELPADAAASVT